MQADEESTIRAGELTMDQDTHDVTSATSRSTCPPPSSSCCATSCSTPTGCCKAQILDHVWEYDFNGDAGIVESYISYLRRKIDPYSSSRSSRPSAASATC
jgi:two-component system OmpR family response regulator